ncbi:MAG TPA: agmatinase [Gammaproteobacteria bacterium]|nr:agmatinase [Gammaproteobacteria bacterium]
MEEMTKKLMNPSQGFLGMPDFSSSDYAKSDVVVIPFGLEYSVSYQGGTSGGPQAILQASHQVEFFDEDLWCEPCQKFNIATMIEPTINQPINEALDQLDTIVSKVVEDGKFPFVLGGEHTLVAGSIRPFIKKYPDLVILHFDAHADLRDQYEGNPFSHACALRRCVDGNEVPLISCGIRNISQEEVNYLESQKHRIQMFFAKDIHQWDIPEMLSSLRGQHVYITFDVDAFDSSLMPATGTPEPGGLFWHHAIDIIKEASKVSTIVGADINELAPRPNHHGCDFLAAKLAYKIMSYAFMKNKL